MKKRVCEISYPGAARVAIVALLALCVSLALTSRAVCASRSKPVLTKKERLMKPLLKEKSMKEGWDLTFHDEFDGASLDRSKWDDKYWHGRTHSNNEQQYYAPDGYEAKNGILRLKGEKKPTGGMPYSSGMISSFDHFSQKYGYFEIRAQFPSGKGYWPAFWLLPATKEWPPEIDILEILGHEPDKIYFTAHWRDEKGEHQSKGDSLKGIDFSKDFHVIGLDWEPGECIWYVDGEERFRYRSTSDIPSEPMYIIANLAVGSDWPGNPDETTQFPGFMDIDYIRVYQKKA